MGDVDLVENAFVSQFTESIPITPEAAVLPSVNGAGQVRNLQEAASLSSTLLTMPSNYSKKFSLEGALTKKLKASIVPASMPIMFQAAGAFPWQRSEIPHDSLFR
jgi:hypothetical protein